MTSISAIGFNIFWTFIFFIVIYYIAALILEYFFDIELPVWPIHYSIGLTGVGFFIGVLGWIWRAFLPA